MANRTLSTAASELVPANASRKSLAIQNQDGSINVFVKREAGERLTVSTTDNDWRIPAGGNLTFNSILDGIQAIQARYTVVAASGAPVVAFFESEDIVR